MNTFFQTLIVGLRLGSIYALVALGYTMVYGIIRLINFAHGDFIMVGGYTMIFVMPLMLRLGLPAWLGVLAAIVVCALVGMGTELIAYRPVRRKGTNMTALITAIAMSLFLENLARDHAGDQRDRHAGALCLYPAHKTGQGDALRVRGQGRGDAHGHQC